MARQRTRVSRKSEFELRAMRKSGRILAELLAEISAAAQAGVTTRELDNLTRQRLREKGAEASFLGYRDYPAAICVEVEDVVVHGIPDGQRLEDGQIVGVDMGVLRGHAHRSAVSFAWGSERWRRRLRWK